MKLVFIQPVGKNYLGDHIYEFLFTEMSEIEAGDDWGTLPASSGSVTPPPLDVIDLVAELSGPLQLELAMNSDYFCFNDSIERIVALGWQVNHQEHEERLVFHVDDTLESVEDKLNNIGLKFKKNNIKH